MVYRMEMQKMWVLLMMDCKLVKMNDYQREKHLEKLNGTKMAIHWWVKLGKCHNNTEGSVDEIDKSK